MSASLTATVPDTLLPAVQAPQVKHVKAGTHDQEPRAQAHMYTAHWCKRVTHSVFPSASAFTLTRQTAHCMLHTFTPLHSHFPTPQRSHLHPHTHIRIHCTHSLSYVLHCIGILHPMLHQRYGNQNRGPGGGGRVRYGTLTQAHHHISSGCIL